MKRILSIFLLITLIVTSAGCANTKKPDIVPTSTASSQATVSHVAAASQSPASEASITITDSRGASVVFEKQPEKVISLMPSNTEILYALGLGEKLIAVSEYCNFPKEVADKQKLAAGEKMNIEAIIALKPDAAFIGKMSAMEDQIKQLEEAGIKVVITEANNLSDTYKVIEMIGKSMGKTSEAEALIETMKKGLDDIKEAVKGKTASSIYVEVSPLQYGLWSCGKNTFIQELIEIIGAKNIFDDVEGWSAVSEEQVLQRNPDIIITTSSPLTGINDPVGEINSRKNWNGINAVKNGKVFMLDADMISRPAPRLLDAAKELVKIVYP